MGEMAYAQEGKPSFQLLSEFEEQLTRLDQSLSALSSILSPVLELPGPAPSGPMPEEAPYHDLHKAVLLLKKLNSRLDDIRQRVRL